MELWQQILAVLLGVGLLIYLAPGIKTSMERSKNAQVKHWGTVALLATALVAFVLFLISTVR